MKSGCCFFSAFGVIQLFAMAVSRPCYRALHGPKISSPARPEKGSSRPGPLRCRKIQARPGPILFLGLLLTQTKTQFCNLHVEYVTNYSARPDGFKNYRAGRRAARPVQDPTLLLFMFTRFRSCFFYSSFFLFCLQHFDAITRGASNRPRLLT